MYYEFHKIHLILIFRSSSNGIYLNDLELGMERSTLKMNNTIKRYYNFFKWHNYCSIHDTHADKYCESVCASCVFLQDKTKTNNNQVYENITGWWNAPYPEICSNSTTIATTSYQIVENPTETTSTNILLKQLILLLILIGLLMINVHSFYNRFLF